MADKSGQTFELPKRTNPNADLFTTQEQRDDAKREKVLDIPLAEIDDFPDHPFQVRNDAAITNVDAGCGLIKVGSALVPFQDKMNKSSKIYRLCSTKPGEFE
jgi:hypothetical protein